MSRYKYTMIPECRVPRGLRWDTPPENAGQIVKVAYASTHRMLCPATDGTHYMRVTDHAVGPEAHTYYMRVSSRRNRS